MKEELANAVQSAASGKSALVVGLGAASVPAWIQALNSPYTQALIAIIGMVVSITIISVNVQTLKTRSAEAAVRRRQEAIRLALLEDQAREKGIEV